MKVASVNSSQNFGMSFKLRGSGAYALADDFVKNSKLEEKFMKEIVVPLSNSKADVIYDGCSVFFKHNADRDYSTIVSTSADSYIVQKTTGCFDYRYNTFKPKDSSKMLYTNEFSKYKGMAANYSDIEAAKNIALYLDAERSGKAIESYAATKNYISPDIGETFEEKARHLSDMYDM